MLFSALYLGAVLASLEIFFPCCLLSYPLACISIFSNDNNLPPASTSISSPQAKFITVLQKEAYCQGTSSENKEKNGRADVELFLHSIGFQSNWDHTQHVQFWHIR